MKKRGNLGGGPRSVGFEVEVAKTSEVVLDLQKRESELWRVWSSSKIEKRILTMRGGVKGRRGRGSGALLA